MKKYSSSSIFSVLFSIFFVSIFLFSPFYFLNSHLALAQTPNVQVILTWYANNFYPADYVGKAYATPNAPITISAEALLENKFIDLSSAKFTWYVNDEIRQKNVIGLKEFTFSENGQIGDDVFVRVSIASNNMSFTGSLRISLQSPKVVIDAPFINTTVPKESSVTLRAIPYFFNISSLTDLIFKWKINNGAREETKGPSLALKISTPNTEEQKILSANIFVQNNINLFEFIQETKKLFIQ